MNHPSIDYVLSFGAVGAVVTTKAMEATEIVQLVVAILGAILLITRLIDWGIKIHAHFKNKKKK